MTVYKTIIAFYSNIFLKTISEQMQFFCEQAFWNDQFFVIVLTWKMGIHFKARVLTVDI